MLTMFTLPRSSTSSLAVPMLTTTTNRIGLSRPPFFQPCSTPQLACPLPLTSSSWRSPYMRFQRQSLRRRCPSNRKNSSCVNNLQLLNGSCRPSEEVSTASSPTNNGAKSELNDDELYDLKIWCHRWLVLGNGEGQKNFPREHWKRCRQELCAPSHPFS